MKQLDLVQYNNYKTLKKNKDHETTRKNKIN